MRAVAQVAAAVIGGICIQYFTIALSGGHADAVLFSGYRGEVQHTDNRIRRIIRHAHHAEGGLVTVMAIYPAKTGRVMVVLVHGGLLPIDLVQVFDQAMNAGVRFYLHQWPVDRRLCVPFKPLAEFTAHKQQFLAWMGILPGIEQA